MDSEISELPPEAEERLQALIAEQQARRSQEADAAKERRRLWLSHHWADQYERCAIIGTQHVCRRCLTLYPLAIAVLVASLAGLQPWPATFDAWFIWLLCIPATLDFLAEKLANTPYSARRQVVVTAMVALALGRGLAYEIDNRWSWYFWGPVLVFGSIWFAAAMFQVQRSMFEKALATSIESGDFSGVDDSDADPTN
ncbi:MAG: hypothetical protein ACR2PK_18205 [Acidimicrobiales bacterium]